MVLVLEVEAPPEPDVLELVAVSGGVSMRIWSLHAVVKKRVATKKEKVGRIVWLCVGTDRARLRLRAKGRYPGQNHAPSSRSRPSAPPKWHKPRQRSQVMRRCCPTSAVWRRRPPSASYLLAVADGDPEALLHMERLPLEARWMSSAPYFM